MGSECSAEWYADSIKKLTGELRFYAGSGSLCSYSDLIGGTIRKAGRQAGR